jgi:hypothetical protein
MRRQVLIVGLWLLISLFILPPVLAQATSQSKEVGPVAGQQIPPFKARDQFGREQTLASLVGPKGLILLFVRSADW